MKTHKRIWQLLGIFCVVGCAGRSPKIDGNVQIGKIQEYDSKVKVSPLPPSGAMSKEESKVRPTPTPRLGLEPTPRVILKGRRHHRRREEVEAPIAASAAKGRRQPPTEDDVGFAAGSRRPLADPYRVGEKVTLRMTYFGVSAGDATLEVKPYVEVNGRKAYDFYSSLTSSSVFSLFYKVNDHCESYLDYDQLVPLNFTLSAVETKQLREVRAFFDWKKKREDYWERRVPSDGAIEEKKKEWDLPPYAQNIYTALQYVRVFALQDGKTYVYPVSDDAHVWDVRATVLRRETLKTDLGTFKTIVVQPKVATQGVLKPMGDVYFWFTDDDRKFPVKLESKIKIGKIVGYLKGLDKGQP